MMTNEDPLSTVTGGDVQQVRAALGLMRHELAAVLCVHVNTLTRWEACGPGPAPLHGFPLEMLCALRDRVVRERRTKEARSTGQCVAQGLRRDGRLHALLDLIRFAASRTIRWPAMEPEA